MKSILVILLSLFIFGCSKENKDELAQVEFRRLGGDNFGPILIPYSPDCITAAMHYSIVQTYADSLAPKMNLKSISSNDVDCYGYSKTWTYKYSAEHKEYYIRTTKFFTGLDSISTRIPLGASTISHPWFDSFRALLTAGKYGGNDFAEKYRDYKIEAALGEPLVPNSHTCWYITYISQSDKSKRLSLIINAISGEATTY